MKCDDNLITGNLFLSIANEIEDLPAKVSLLIRAKNINIYLSLVVNATKRCPCINKKTQRS